MPLLCPNVRILLIVNATASSVTPRKRVVISKALGADYDLEVAVTTRRGHATRLAHAAALDGMDVVAVLAGDGTLNEAANGLAGSATALAALPGGSTNVFARSIGVARDAVDATGQLLDALERNSIRRIGLGDADGRRFLFHVGVGFDAAVVQEVERRSTAWALKRYAAHPMFLLAALDTWFRAYDHSRPRFTITISAPEHLRPLTGPEAETNTETISGCIMATLSNQSPYTYFGSRPIVTAPDASLNRPLVLTGFGTRRASTFLRLAGSALSSGRLVRRHHTMTHRSGLHELEIAGDRPFPWQADGDYMGEVEKLRITWKPDDLALVVP